MEHKALNWSATQKPFPDLADWWDVGDTFAAFMSESIISQWSLLPGNDGNLRIVNCYSLPAIYPNKISRFGCWSVAILPAALPAQPV